MSIFSDDDWPDPTPREITLGTLKRIFNSLNEHNKFMSVLITDLKEAIAYLEKEDK